MEELAAFSTLLCNFAKKIRAVGSLNGFRRHVAFPALDEQLAMLYSICIDAIFKRSEMLGHECAEECSQNQ